jgi:hypothetical protein
MSNASSISSLRSSSRRGSWSSVSSISPGDSVSQVGLRRSLGIVSRRDDVGRSGRVGHKVYITHGETPRSRHPSLHEVREGSNGSWNSPDRVPHDRAGPGGSRRPSLHSTPSTSSSCRNPVGTGVPVGVGRVGPDAATVGGYPGPPVYTIQEDSTCRRKTRDSPCHSAPVDLAGRRSSRVSAVSSYYPSESGGGSSTSGRSGRVRSTTRSLETLVPPSTAGVRTVAVGGSHFARGPDGALYVYRKKRK